METQNTYGPDGINKKIVELNQQKENLMIQREEINKKIKALDIEITKWQIDISPKQTSLF